jgi:hypothetical protein
MTDIELNLRVDNGVFNKEDIISPDMAGINF